MQPSSTSSPERALIEQKLASLETKLHKVETQVEALEAMKSSVQAIEARMEGTPALGLKQHFKCQCGASVLWRYISSAPNVAGKLGGAGFQSNNLGFCLIMK
jgi:hypothetical protein